MPPSSDPPPEEPRPPSALPPAEQSQPSLDEHGAASNPAQAMPSSAPLPPAEPQPPVHDGADNPVGSSCGFAECNLGAIGMGRKCASCAAPLHHFCAAKVQGVLEVLLDADMLCSLCFVEPAGSPTTKRARVGTGPPPHVTLLNHIFSTYERQHDFDSRQHKAFAKKSLIPVIMEKNFHPVVSFPYSKVTQQDDYKTFMYGTLRDRANFVNHDYFKSVSFESVAVVPGDGNCFWYCWHAAMENSSSKLVKTAAGRSKARVLKDVEDTFREGFAGTLKIPEDDVVCKALIEDFIKEEDSENLMAAFSKVARDGHWAGNALIALICYVKKQHVRLWSPRWSSVDSVCYFTNTLNTFRVFDTLKGESEIDAEWLNFPVMDICHNNLRFPAHPKFESNHYDLLKLNVELA